MKVSLLPGWGLGLAPLQPLADYLSNKHEVQLLPLPECTLLEQALDELDAQIPADSWLIGWSLGGMLATALAHRRGNNCPGLVTLASNACFVARNDWPHAMPQREFNNFSRRAARDWSGTLKGFQQLCLHGGQIEAVPAELSATASTDTESRLASLSWLAQLDNRTAIAELQCRQLHVLAEADALVLVGVTHDLQLLNPQAQVCSWPGSHAFVLTDHRELAAAVHAFMTGGAVNG